MPLQGSTHRVRCSRVGKGPSSGSSKGHHGAGSCGLLSCRVHGTPAAMIGMVNCLVYSLNGARALVCDISSWLPCDHVCSNDPSLMPMLSWISFAHGPNEGHGCVSLPPIRLLTCIRSSVEHIASFEYLGAISDLMQLASAVPLHFRKWPQCGKSISLQLRLLKVLRFGHAQSASLLNECTHVHYDNTSLRHKVSGLPSCVEQTA